MKIVSAHTSSPQRQPFSKHAASPQITSNSKRALDSPQPSGVKKRKITKIESPIPQARIAQTVMHTPLSEKDGWELLPGILANFEKQCPSCFLSTKTCSRNCLVRKVLPSIRLLLKFERYSCCFFCFLPDCNLRRQCRTPNTLGLAFAMLLSHHDVVSKHFSSTPPLIGEEEEDIRALATWLCALETGNRTPNMTRVALLAVRLRYFE